LDKTALEQMWVLCTYHGRGPTWVTSFPVLTSDTQESNITQWSTWITFPVKGKDFALSPKPFFLIPI
jgi:hypothetical protein